NEELNKMKRDLDRLMNRLRDEMDVSFFPGLAKKLPSVDLAETERTVVIRAVLPDMKAEDLQVSVHENFVTIRGESEIESQSNEKNVVRTNRVRKTFERVIPLPCRVNADETDATFSEGVLRVVLPKRGPDRARTVEIKKR
ncbi:MAG TPA: Hsp20/alpha crystallin family protein, partial [Syntrophales bacterium]|nr:Hsp20/alpha crystallin family protein [Syntrophales bacterium]